MLWIHVDLSVTAVGVGCRWRRVLTGVVLVVRSLAPFVCRLPILVLLSVGVAAFT